MSVVCVLCVECVLVCVLACVDGVVCVLSVECVLVCVLYGTYVLA